MWPKVEADFDSMCPFEGYRSMKRPWVARMLLRIVETPRGGGVRACDEMIEYEYKFWLRYYEHLFFRVVFLFFLDFGLTLSFLITYVRVKILMHI